MGHKKKQLTPQEALIAKQWATIKIEKKQEKRNKRKFGKMFMSVELAKLYKAGQLDSMIKDLGNIITPSNLIASANDTTVFSCTRNGEKYVCKVTPKNLRFFKHFGKERSGKEFKKYINRLDPYFLPVEDILYEDENIFVYTQKKCSVIESSNIDKKVVIEVFRLIQFMLVNNILLTDLAPHNLGILHKKVVIFDYHGLHRLTKDGSINREDWWRRLARNLTRFVCSLEGAHKRAEYSLLMQNCTEETIQKMEGDSSIPAIFSSMIRYLSTEQNNASIDKLCDYLEKCIIEIKAHK